MGNENKWRRVTIEVKEYDGDCYLVNTLYNSENLISAQIIDDAEYAARSHRFGKCAECGKVPASLGCSSYVSNVPCYACDEGHIEYLNNESFKDGIKRMFHAFRILFSLPSDKIPAKYKKLRYPLEQSRKIANSLSECDPLELMGDMIDLDGFLEVGDVINIDADNRGVVIALFDDEVIYMDERDSRLHKTTHDKVTKAYISGGDTVINSLANMKDSLAKSVF